MRKLTKYIDIQRQQEMNHVKHAANYVKVRMWFFDFWRASVHALRMRQASGLSRRVIGCYTCLLFVLHTCTFQQ